MTQKKLSDHHLSAGYDYIWTFGLFAVETEVREPEKGGRGETEGREGMGGGGLSSNIFAS